MKFIRTYSYNEKLFSTNNLIITRKSRWVHIYDLRPYSVRLIGCYLWCLYLVWITFHKYDQQSWFISLTRVLMKKISITNTFKYSTENCSQYFVDKNLIFVKSFYKLISFRNDLSYDVQLFPGNITSIKKSRFDPDLPTKIIIHGWTHGKDVPWLREMREGWYTISFIILLRELKSVLLRVILFDYLFFIT